MSRARVVAAAIGLVVLAVAIVVAIGLFRSPDPGDLLGRSFTSSRGVTSQYHLFRRGVPTDRPVGLLVHFHGDGAYEFHHPDSDYAFGGPEGIVAQARDHDLLVLALLSPDRRGTVTWWEDGPANADHARELIEREVLDRYDIDPGNIWLVGYSGGAQFITQYFLPRHPDLIEGGGSVVFGGGEAPRRAREPFSQALKDHFTMHWYTGAEDTGTPPEWFDALDAARDGHDWYRRRGFQVSIETPEGVGHDDLPFGRIVGQRLAQRLG